jgi:hypothetical protein
MQFRNLDITDDEKENMVKVCLCVAFDIQLFLIAKEGMELCQVTTMT